MTVTLRQLRYFLALTETRHFGKAADRVHVSQPALSVQIRDLEALLGGPLVERGSAGLPLTPLGRQLEEKARAVVDGAQAIEGLGRRRSGLSGPLAVGMIPTIAPYLLPALIPALRRDHPDLDLSVQEAPTARLAEALAAGRIDAAVLATDEDTARFRALPLFNDRFLLAGTAPLIRSMTPPPVHPHPDAVDSERLLLLEEGHCLSDQALAACAIDRSALRLDLGATSLATLSGLASGGVGVTFLPELSLASELARQEGLTVLRFANPEPSRQVRLLLRRETPDDPWVGMLANALVASAEPLLAHARDAGRVYETVAPP
ncbi:LysR substrate-binding domain-containing protein [Oceanomicrobium pacificus]|uniref:LysR family transcriptional regulator n=1 Tax=Oceanomicrobium pacificus TaxID=2692916 RepID=A0A6B0TX94_9RHOB|nr:LysR substrate-binding domain-containing protein [Oceanomicrobium pacificus]MXU65774.1 LysR family transcriptional regulator [Oceanomicrobium pacificus]